MGWEEDVARLQHKEELIGYVQDAVGNIPDNIRVVINALAHPDVVEHTKEFFSLQMTNACQIFGAGWSCQRQAESKFGYNGEEKDEDAEEWCEPCLRARGSVGSTRKAFSLASYVGMKDKSFREKLGLEPTNG